MAPGIRMGLDGRTEKPYFQITNIVHEFIFAMMVIRASYYQGHWHQCSEFSTQAYHHQSPRVR